MCHCCMILCSCGSCATKLISTPDCVVGCLLHCSGQAGNHLSAPSWLPKWTSPFCIIVLPNHQSYVYSIINAMVETILQLLNGCVARLTTTCLLGHGRQDNVSVCLVVLPR